MRRTPAPFALLTLLPALALASCASSRGFPEEIVTLYDAARPDGLIEIELDRDGSLREAEAEIAVEDVPSELIVAAQRLVPGGRVIGAEREHTRDGPGFEVQLDVEGLKTEVVLDEDGNVLETEQELRPGEAPAAVLSAADGAVPDGELKSVEIVTRAGEAAYHVKKTRAGATYKIVVSPQGRVIRAVREARAKLKIPLR